jgi:hypothetical protein
MANLNENDILAQNLKKKIEKLAISSIMVMKELEKLQQEKPLCRRRKKASARRKRTK